MEDLAKARAAIGARIAKARLAAGYLNAAEFSRACGVSPNSVYRWERGEIAPDIFRLLAVARATRVTTDWLLTGVENVTSPRSALSTWRRTPIGRAASEEAYEFLSALPLDGHTPSELFYDIALEVYETGQFTPEQVVGAARFNENLRRENVRREEVRRR